MLIKQQFRVAFSAVAVALLAAMAVLLAMNARVENAELQRSWANQIVGHAFDCNMLGSESILQEKARSREQYASASAALQALIDKPPPGKLAARYHVR